MKRFLSLSLAVATALMCCSCGTIFKGERRDTKASHQIDVLIFGLDCVGLIFGIVPGVVALIVDFSNDTIYYSIDEMNAKNKADVNLSKMKSIHVADMSREGIARALSAELGHPIAPEAIIF